MIMDQISGLQAVALSKEHFIYLKSYERVQNLKS